MPNKIIVEESKVPEIISLYQEQYLGLGQIRVKTGYTQHVIKSLLLANGVDIRPSGTRGKPISADMKAQIISLYTSGVGMRSISKKFHLEYSRIRELLVANGLEIRPSGWTETLKKSDSTPAVVAKLSINCERCRSVMHLMRTAKKYKCFECRWEKQE
jgi:hypothetical protein